MAIAPVTPRKTASGKNAYSRILRTAANDLGTPPIFSEVAARNVVDVWMGLATSEQTLSTFAEWKCGIMPWQAAPVMQLMFASIAAPVMQPDDIVLCAGFQPYAWQYAVQADTLEIANTYLGKSTPANIHHFSTEDIVNYLTANRRSKSTITVAVHIDSESGWNDIRAIAAAAVKSENAIALFVTTAEGLPTNLGANVIAQSCAQNWNVSAAAIQSAIEDVRNEGYIRAIACVDDTSAADLDNAMMQAANYSPETWQAHWAQYSDDAERALWASCKAPVQTA